MHIDKVTHRFMRLIAAAAAAFSLLQAPAALAQPVAGLPDFTQIVEKTDPAVVNIRTTATVPVRNFGGNGDPYDMFRWFFGPDFNPGGQGAPGPRGRQQQPQQPQAPQEERTVPRGVGSGFFISNDGYILTNAHVVDEATDIFVTLSDGREFKAKLIGSDARTDVALVKIDSDQNITPLEIGDPKLLRKGQWVLAIGSPFGLESTVTAGIVSATGRDTGEYLPFIQTDVAVNPGNSGGPLINLNGEVVGINSQIISRSGGFMGISLAIPIDEAMQVVDQLRATGRVTRGRIGVQIGEVSKEVADAIGLPKAEGALVSMVEPDGPADKAGVEAGDVIVKFNKQPITRWSDLPRIVGQVKPGTESSLEVWRKGRARTLKVNVAQMEDGNAAAADSDSTENAAPSQANALGLAVTELTAEARERLRVRGGVLVQSAEGAAASAGLAQGDVILALNDQDVTSPSQFNQLVSGLDTSRAAALLVRRGDQTQWVAVQPAK